MMQTSSALLALLMALALSSVSAYGEYCCKAICSAVVYLSSVIEIFSDPSKWNSNLTYILHNNIISSSSFSAPSFVPRSHGVVSPLPKNVVASHVYGTRRTQSKSNDIKMMPIGVPKVAYRVPGSQQADW